MNIWKPDKKFQYSKSEEPQNDPLRFSQMTPYISRRICIGMWLFKHFHWEPREMGTRCMLLIKKSFSVPSHTAGLRSVLGAEWKSIVVEEAASRLLKWKSILHSTPRVREQQKRSKLVVDILMQPEFFLCSSSFPNVIRWKKSW